MADLLHFRDAATSIGMSQPALSSAIAALEEGLGIQLVERTTRRVLITPVGQRLAAHARNVLAELDALVEEAAAARKPYNGPLHLGVIPTVAPYLLPALLKPLRSGFPDLEIYVHEEQTAVILDGIAAGRLDAAVLALPTGAAGLVELPLYDEDFALVVPEGHEAGGRSDLPREVLSGLDILLLDEGHCLRDQALEICREVGATGGDVTRAASLPTLVQLVAGGLGATLLPATAVPVDARSGSGLTVGRFRTPAPSRRIGMIHRSSSARGTEIAGLAVAARAAVAARRLPVRIVEPAVPNGAALLAAYEDHVPDESFADDLDVVHAELNKPHEARDLWNAPGRGNGESADRRSR